MIIARQSTARTVTIGPVLDADGVAVTGGVVGELKIAKNGGAPAALNGSATLTHRHTGHYSLALTASDLDTVGQAEIVMDDTVNACPMKELTVIEEAVYDALFVAAGAGYATPAKLLSLIQSIARKDVTVDPDIGGTYDDATDSLEAIRDRGDAAWTSGGGATIDYDQLLPQLVGARISLVQQVFVRGQPLRIVQGDSGDVAHGTEIRFHWDNPPSLSGATVNFYGEHRDTGHLFSWDADFETISATREDIVVEWDDDHSEALTEGQYDCRLVVEFADGQKYHIVIGQEGSDRYIFPLDVLPAWEGSP